MDTERQRIEALAALDRIGGRLQRGALDLPSFDEEQLAACAPELRGRRLVPLPAVDELDDVGYAVAIERGRSSLLERDYLDGDAGAAVPIGELALVTAARAMPSLVAIVDRVAGADARSSLYLFGLGSGALLEERPEAGGHHRFTLRSVEDAAASVAAFVDPEGRGARDGEPHELLGVASGDVQVRAEIAERITSASVVARVFVTVAAPDGGALIDEDFSVATADEGLWLVGGYEDPRSHERRAAAREISTPTLQTLLAGCLTVA